MGPFEDIGVRAAIFIVSVVVSLVAFAILCLQPVNDRVYFPKLYIKRGISTTRREFLSWIPSALRMPEHDLIYQHGLDSAVYLRIYLLGLKIFGPITIFAWIILAPVNWTNKTLEIINHQLAEEDEPYSDLDKLSILNIHSKSHRFWVHILMAYFFTFWTCYMLRREYKKITSMRLHFLASKRRSPDQFTVLARNIPSDPDESVKECIDNFFRVNHPDHYLTNQMVYNTNKLAKLVQKKKKKQNWLDYYELKYSQNRSKPPVIKIGFLGLWGDKMDPIEYTSDIDRLSKQIDIEREIVVIEPKYTMPVSFVSFKTRWGAAVCAQTQQSNDQTLWLTDWAPEPNDIYWKNLAIPYVQLKVRRLIICVAFFFFTFCSVVAFVFVQRIPIIKGIEKLMPFLFEVKFIKSVGEDFLPGIALKLLLLFVPKILMIMSRFEGFTSISSIERKVATKCYFFSIVSVFPGGLIAEIAFDQELRSAIIKSPNKIPESIVVAILGMTKFYITFIMIDGWVGPALEILRLKPLIFYHFKNLFWVKTEKDKIKAMDPGTIKFNTSEPQIQFYFLLGLIYAVITPALLPFMVIFFAFAYIIYRHQLINVYNQKYESAAAFWPDVHGRIVTSLVISQLLLLGLLSTKKETAAQSTPFLLVLPVLTIYFHKFCKCRYESAFVRYPLEEAMRKDTLDRATEPDINLKGYLENAYMHPVLKGGNEEEDRDTEQAIKEWEQKSVIVRTKSLVRRNTSMIRGNPSSTLSTIIQNDDDDFFGTPRLFSGFTRP